MCPETHRSEFMRIRNENAEYTTKSNRERVFCMRVNEKPFIHLIAFENWCRMQNFSNFLNQIENKSPFRCQFTNNTIASSGNNDPHNSDSNSNSSISSTGFNGTTSNNNVNVDRTNDNNIHINDNNLSNNTYAHTSSNLTNTNGLYTFAVVVCNNK